MKIKVNPDLTRLSLVKLREYRKELKYLLEQAEAYAECPRHAVQGLRNQLTYINTRLKRKHK
jgi:hypothetical protein